MTKIKSLLSNDVNLNVERKDEGGRNVKNW